MLAAKFGPPTVGPSLGLLNLLTLIALAYCVIKVFFFQHQTGWHPAHPDGGGVALSFQRPQGLHRRIQQWCKQIFALCLTAFLQTVLLFLGLLTFQDNLLLGLGIMLAAGEVPRIAGQFGLDTSTRANLMSSVYAAQSAVNLTRTIVQAAAK